MHRPVELRLELSPRARFDVIDVREQASAHAAKLAAYPQTLYSSFHTTAGYLDPGLAARLTSTNVGIRPYIGMFQTLFPAGAGYQHDELHLRAELSEDQRGIEPRNADAHLAFIAAGLRTCVRYANHASHPVYFVDLDGVAGKERRQRSTSITAFNTEEVVARERFAIPLSRHPIESVNLKDHAVGLYARLQGLIDQHDVAKGRIHLTLASGEHQSALTINEYETLLMRHDLADVLRNPLRFAAEKGRNLLAEPWSIPARTIDYAKYDLVRLFNEAFDAFRMSESRMEALVARLLAVPARRFLRMKRSVSLLVSDHEHAGSGSIASGRYQCPILVQWRKAPRAQRWIDITLTRLC
jgi:thiamine phosphate synthase YjbQ (UPF0047 family)